MVSPWRAGIGALLVAVPALIGWVDVQASSPHRHHQEAPIWTSSVGSRSPATGEPHDVCLSGPGAARAVPAVSSPVLLMGCACCRALEWMPGEA